MSFLRLAGREDNEHVFLWENNSPRGKLEAMRLASGGHVASLWEGSTTYKGVNSLIASRITSILIYWDPMREHYLEPLVRHLLVSETCKISAWGATRQFLLWRRRLLLSCGVMTGYGFRVKIQRQKLRERKPPGSLGRFSCVQRREFGLK